MKTTLHTLIRVALAGAGLFVGAQLQAYQHHGAGCGTHHAKPGGCCPKVVSHCAEESYWYLGATGSLVWHNDMDYDHASVPANGDSSFDIGGGFGLSAGYALPSYYMRAEAELLYRRNNLDSMDLTGAFLGATAGSYSASGHTQDLAVMFNLVADIPVHELFSVYVGGGIGVSFNELELDYVNRTSAETFFTGLERKQNSTLFAWQVMGGVSYDINDTVALTAGYRLFATSKLSYNKNLGLSKSNIPMYHSIDLGLRFKL